MADHMVTINFEGRPLACRAGTSVAAALWEQGIRHLSHSPKYGRPRGVTCARSQCTACLMRVDGVPNIRVCETPVREGMSVARQDAGAFYGAPMQKSLALGGRIFPVGFYYKWFTRPAALSRLFLKMIRPLTGVGRLPEARDLPPLPAGNATPPATDLGHHATVVVGAGLAGLQAAAAAPGPVLLLDENPRAGGLRLAALREIADAPGDADPFPILDAALAHLEQAAATVDREDVTFNGEARVVAGYAPGGLLVRQGGTLATLGCDRLVWAAGAMDTLGLFPGNDTPGVMGPRALLRLLVRDGLDLGGRRALVVGSGLDFWLAAALLDARGARVTLMVTGDDKGTGIPAAVRRKWPLVTGMGLAGVTGRDEKEVRAIFTPQADTPGAAGNQLRLDADLLVICERGKPTYDIPYQLGARLELDPDRGGFVTVDSPADLVIETVGEAAGDLPDALFVPTPEVSA